MAAIKGALVVGAVAVAFAGPAYAFQCPGLVAKIDVLLASATNLGEAQAEEIKGMRDDGEALHGSGKHGEAVDVLNEALSRLEDAGGSASGSSGYE